MTNSYNFVKQVKDIIKNVDGNALSKELDSVLSDWEPFFAVTPVPMSVAQFVDALIGLMNEVEGSEFLSEVKKLKFPKIPKA